MTPSRIRRLAQGWFETANAQPGEGSLHAVDNARALCDQALALAIGPLGILFGDRWHARHGAVAPFSTQPPQGPALRQLDPVVERVVAIGTIARMCPQPGRLMPDTVHVEGVEADLLWHLVPLAPAGCGTYTVGHCGLSNGIRTRWTR